MDTALYFKALGDGTRLKIVRALMEREMYQEQLCQELGLTAATVSFHMKKLTQAGLVDFHRVRVYTMYRLKTEALQPSVADVICPKAEEAPTKPLDPGEQFRRKVVRAFMPNGYCATMPAHEKKRMVIYEEIYRGFTPGQSYPEKTVNEIISRVFADYCLVRRTMIEMGWMTRDARNIYTAVKEHN